MLTPHVGLAFLASFPVEHFRSLGIEVTFVDATDISAYVTTLRILSSLTT